MKKMLVLTALIGTVMVGCTREKQDKVSKSERFEPKYTLGQEITVQSGFLKGLSGKIMDCSRCVSDDQGTYESDVVCYTIAFKTTDEDGKEVMRIYKNVAERELNF